MTSSMSVSKEEHADVRAMAARIRDLVERGRAFAVDACGSSLLILGGSGAPAARFPAGSSTPFSHFGRGRSASFARSTSLNPGDVDAIADALSKGARVAAAPFMGRAAALWRGFDAIPVVEVAQGIKTIADALVRS